MHNAGQIITFGKHKGKKVSEIPPAYFFGLKIAATNEAERLDEETKLAWGFRRINLKLTFGKHKYRFINDVPIEYLLNLSDESLKTWPQRTLVDFIRSHLNILKSAALEGKTHVRQICYPKPDENKKPIKHQALSVHKNRIEPKEKINYEVPNDYKTKKNFNIEKFSSELKCSSGKKVYASQSDAAQALKTIKRSSSRDKSHVPKREYHCDECHQWHLTSKVEDFKKSKSSH